MPASDNAENLHSPHPTRAPHFAKNAKAKLANNAPAAVSAGAEAQIDESVASGFEGVSTSPPSTPRAAKAAALYSPPVSDPDDRTTPNRESQYERRIDNRQSGLPRPNFSKRIQHDDSRFGVESVNTGFSHAIVPIVSSTASADMLAVPSAETFETDRSAQSVLEASWEVDHFVFPEVVEQLSRQCADMLIDLIANLHQHVLNGSKRLMVTGVKCGEGRTTVTLLLARALSAVGRRVAVVDADIVHPNLGEQLGMAHRVSWLSDNTNHTTAAEYLVRDRSRSLTTVPLLRSNRNTYARHAYVILNELLNRIEPHFEDIILDFGPVSHIDSTTFRQVDIANSAVFVHDPANSDVHEYSRAFDKFRSVGVEKFALVKNNRIGSKIES